MVPKCTSWLGHKFEARHTEPELDKKLIELCIASAKYTTGAVHLMENAKASIYERDICVRCGYVIDRKVNEKAND